MKTTRRVLSLVLAMLMLFSMFTVAASAKSIEIAETGVTMTGGEVLYLKPNSNWSADGARFACYFFGTGNTWASMEECPNDAGVYKVEVPSGSWTNVIFCRMSGSSTTNSWTNKWNQSGDLVYDGTNNYCAINSGQWDCGSNVTWSVFTETGAETDPSEDVTEPEASGDQTATESETAEPTEAETVAPVYKTVYCINSAKWDAVSAHAWDGAGAGTAWPGLAMTKTEDTVNGFDVYEITFEADYTNVIFNNNNNGSQTGDLTLMENQYYDVKSAAWYASLEEVPALDVLASDVYIAGSFNSWSTVANELKLTAEDADTATISLDLEAATTYEFKIVKSGSWMGCSTAITADVADLAFSTSVAGNAKITTVGAGTYVFTYNLTNDTLSVTYPEVVVEPTEEASESTGDQPATEPEATEAETTEPVEVEYMTIYFQNNWMWSDISIYYWGSAGVNPAWPGYAMELYGNDGNYDIYCAKVPTDITGLIISGTKDDGTGTIDQTPDVEEGFYDGICYYMKWEDGNQVGFEDITVMLPSEEETEEPATEPEASGDQPATEPSEDVTDSEATEPEATEPEATEPVEVEYMTIYFQNNWMWSDISIYYWGSAGVNPSWPGYAMELYGNDGNYDIYSAQVPTDITGLIINGTKDDGTGTVDQTPDITEGFYDGICYYMKWEDGNQVGFEDITVMLPSEEETEEPATEPEASGDQPATEPSEDVTEPTEAPVYPEKVENITTSATATTIKFTWDVLEGATKYWVYQYSEKYDTWSSVKSAYTNEAVVKLLTGGTTYQFKVIARIGDDYYLSLDNADVVEVTTSPAVATDSLTAVEGVVSADLTWEPIEGAVKYWVYKSTSETGPFYIYTSTTDTACTVKRLRPDSTYYFKVTALTYENDIDCYSKVEDSPLVTVNTGSASIITTALTSNTSTTATISWPAFENADKYWVLFSTTSADTTDKSHWTTWTSTTDTSYTFKNLEANTVYYLNVCARYTIDGAVSTIDYLPIMVRTAYADENVITFTPVDETSVTLTWADDIEDVQKTWVYAVAEDGTETLLKSTTENTVTVKLSGYENYSFALKVLDTQGRYGYLTKTGGESYHI